MRLPNGLTNGERPRRRGGAGGAGVGRCRERVFADLCDIELFAGLVAVLPLAIELQESQRICKEEDGSTCVLK